jgi:hypothetical protein
MDFKKSLAIGVFGATLLATASAQTPFPRLSYVDLGQTQGSLQVLPRDISPTGVVAGSIKYARAENAFLWDTVLRDVGQLPGRGFTQMNTINRFGLGIGTSGSGGNARGFLFQNNTITQLNTNDPLIGPFTRGGFNNDAGTLLWDGFDQALGATTSYYRFSYGNRQIPPLNPGLIFESRGITMGQLGFAMGVETWVDGTTHAWLANPGNVTTPPTNAEVNPRTGAEDYIMPTSVVDGTGEPSYTINVGQTVVDSSNKPWIISRCLLVDPTVTWTGIPLENDTLVEANDLKTFGNYAVGRSGRHTFINGRFNVTWTGVIFQRVLTLQGPLLIPTDVNTLLPANSPIRIDNVIAVNDNGQLVASYTQNGIVRAVVLTEQSTPQLLQLRDVNTLQLSNNVVGGNNHIGDVSVDIPDNDNDLVLTGSSSSAVARPPSTILVPRGEEQTRFVIQTNAVTVSTPVTITVSRAGFSLSSTLRVNPATLLNITITSQADAQGTNFITGGLVAPARVNFDGRVGATAGNLVALSSNNNAAQVPASVNVPLSQTGANFNINTAVVNAPVLTTISARFNNVTRTRNLRVTTPMLLDLTLSTPNVVGGAPVIGTVTLTNSALFPGAAVQVASSNTNVAIVPPTVTVLTGAKTRNFQITTLPQSLNVAVTVTALFNSQSKTRTLIVRTPQLISFTINPPTTVLGGAILTGQVIVDGNAPASGWDVFVSSSDGRAATVPASVRIQPGNSSATFAITTLIAESSRNVVITATRSTVTITRNITVQAADLQPMTFTFQDVNMNGQLNINEPIRIAFSLNRPAQAGGARIFLLSSNPAQFTLPNGLIIPAGQQTGQVFTQATGTGTFTVTATRGLIQQTLDITVQ